MELSCNRHRHYLETFIRRTQLSKDRLVSRKEDSQTHVGGQFTVRFWRRSPPATLDRDHPDYSGLRDEAAVSALPLPREDAIGCQ